MNLAKQSQKSLMKIIEENGAARFTEITFAQLNKIINTPNYIFTSKGGALNGMTKYNAKNVDYPIISLNFADLHSYKDTLTKFKQHISQQQKDDQQINHLKRYFNHEDKVVMFAPYPYSLDKERIGGYNDEQYIQLNGKEKVNIDAYYKMVMESQPDIVVPPCEQVTLTGGKKKRKRAAKAALKNSEQLQKMIKDENSHSQMLVPIFLGDDEGLDSYEMRQFKKLVLRNEDLTYSGYIIYGNDGLSSPAKYQEMLDFFAETPKEKVRVLHGTGNPVDVLNGILSGVDLFKGDYPLELAAQGIALEIRDFSLSKSRKIIPTSLELSKKLETLQPKLINLSSQEHLQSKLPLVHKCMCYTCKNYNRAYLYHLLDVKEMNANILIGIHNLWVYERFFQQIRASISKIHHYIQDFIEMNCEEKK